MHPNHKGCKVRSVFKRTPDPINMLQLMESLDSPNIQDPEENSRYMDDVFSSKSIVWNLTVNSCSNNESGSANQISVSEAAQRPPGKTVATIILPILP